MIPVKQTIRHNPEHGAYGDCHRAAVATILELPIEKVPHFAIDGPTGEVFSQRVDDFLAGFNLAVFDMPFPGDLTLKQVLDFMGTRIRDRKLVFLLGGLSPRLTNHTVVCQGDELVHDPHPDAGGLIGPCTDGFWWVTTLTVLNAVVQFDEGAHAKTAE